MSRFQFKNYVAFISFLLMVTWFTDALPAASPQKTADEGLFNSPQSTFVDSGQLLGGQVESSAAVLGDVDADGDLDAVVASFGGPSKIYINQGGDQGGSEGTFLDSGQSLAAAMAVDVDLQDLDGDGDLDAFLVKDAFEDSNEVWLNNGNGLFTQTGQIFGDHLSTSVALGDLDGINGPDAFIGRGFGQPSKVWLNNGNGAFTNSGQSLDSDSIDLMLGDLDGDGDLDGFSANGGNNKIWVNQGGTQAGTPGIFMDSGKVLSSPLSHSIDLGDLDGDGDLDAWVGSASADRIWVNQGADQGGNEGNFLQGAQTSQSATRDITLGDLDIDGDLDAFLAKETGNEVWINQAGDQDGNEGEFLDSSQILGDSKSEGLALGDVDGDGDLDVFVANWGQPDKVWLNELPLKNADVSVTLPTTSYNITEFPICPYLSKSSFNVIVHNAGPNEATNVTLSADDGDFGEQNTYIIETLAPGGSASVFLNVKPAGVRVGPVLCVSHAVVDVTADQEDPNLENNSGESQHVWYTCNNIIGCLLTETLCDVEQGNHWLQNLSSPVIDFIVYQYIRDGVLAGTGEGQYFIDLFYTHDPEIQSLLDEDPSLKAEGISTLQLWETNLWALSRGKGDSAAITAEQVSAVDSFLANLSAAASPELQQVIAAERDRLPDLQEFAGMTMREARGRIVGYSTYLPLITDP